MPVDEEGKYIRIRMRDPADFVKESFKTVTISEEKGISSVMGKLKSDPDGSMVVQNYMFLKDKGWTVEEAKKWVKDHKEKKSLDSRIERRNFEITEFRAITDDKGLRHLTGHAAVFDKLSDTLGWFREKIDAGAFKKTIKNDDIRALKNHNSDYVLGRNIRKTLALKEDDRGLSVDIIPPDTQWARDYMVSIDRGDVDQMSFQFDAISDRWETVNKVEIRTLIEVKLYDVSPVTFAAYPDTQVALRSFEQWNKSVPPSSDGSGGNVDPSILTGLMAEEDLLYRKIRNF